MDLVECPKRMEYGPCGGVDLDGSCEVADSPCVFLGSPTVRWHGVASARPAGHSDPVPRAQESGGAQRMRQRLETGRVVVADFPARALDAASVLECADVLAGSVDAVLAGDMGSARVQFPPAYRARLIHDAGLEVWTGLNCRDRNRVALEGELAALALEGVGAVHCVTGDHTLTGGRPDAAPVFDLDSTELASLARAAGHLVSVAEAPASPPVERRAARLAEKARAGAEVCFVNHAGGADAVARFVAESRDTGADLAFIPCVPVVLDAGGAQLLGTFPALVLPDGYLERILGAADAMREGVAAAVELAERMLAIEGVRGVNLSGGSAPGSEARTAEGMARITEALR